VQRHPIALFALTSLLAVLLAACSSAPAGTNEAPPATIAVANITDACERMIVYQQRCGTGNAATSSACAEGRRQQCGAQHASESEAYRDAVLACIDERTTCADDIEGCLFDKLWTATPTAGQLKVRDDFCDRCKAGGSACARDFFVTGTDGGHRDAGVGFLLLTVGDEIASKVNQACAHHMIAMDCAGEFSACVGTELYLALPNDPPACSTP
jgi:hypothetical protein